MNNTRVFKFSLKVVIERVVIAISFPCKLQVAWKRGNQKLETKQSDLNVNVANFNEEMEMNSNLYLEGQLFKEKKCAFTVTLFSSKGNKVAGQVSIDIAQYLNKKIDNFREELRLEKCPDKHAKLHVRFQFACIQELDIDQLSRISFASNAEDIEDTTQASQIIQQPKIQEQPKQQSQQEAMYSECEVDEIRNLLSREIKKVQQKDSQISQLTQELETKQEQLTDTKQQLEQIKNKFYETIDKLQSYEEQIVSIDDMKKCMNSKIKQLEDYCQQCKQQITELSEQLKQKQQIISQQDQKLSGALGQMQVMRQRIQQYEELEQQESARKSTGTSKDIELMQKRITDLEKQIQREQQKQEQDYALYQVQLKNLQSQLLDKVELINKLQKSGEPQNLQKELDSYKQKEEQFNKVLNQYKDQIQKQLQAEKKMKQQHEQDIERQNDVIIKLKCQLGDLFNTAYDIGGNKLVDRLQQAVGLS